MEHFILGIVVCLCLLLAVFCFGLVRRLAEESAWKAAFASRLVEIAFRETIAVDAQGGVVRAPAPSVPAGRGEEGADGEPPRT